MDAMFQQMMMQQMLGNKSAEELTADHDDVEARAYQVLVDISQNIPHTIWQAKPEMKSQMLRLAEMIYRDAHERTTPVKIIEMQRVLPMIEGYIQFAKSWPTEPQDLLEDWCHSLKQQREEFRQDHEKKKAAGEVSDDEDDFFASEDKGGYFCESDLDDGHEDHPMVRAKEKHLPRFSDDPNRDADNKGDVHLVPRLPKSVVKEWLIDSPVQRITFFKECCLRAQLRNPLALPSGDSYYICDLCNRDKVSVAFQVIGDGEDGERDHSAFFKNCEGMDICVACGVYYLEQTAQDYRAFLRAKFKGKEAAAAALAAASAKAEAEEGPESPVTKKNKLDMIELERRWGGHCAVKVYSAHRIPHPTKPKVAIARAAVGIAPRGSHIVAWTASPIQRNPAVDGAVPPKWRERCRIAFRSAQRGGGGGDGLSREPSMLSNQLQSTESFASAPVAPVLQNDLGSCGICLEDMHIIDGDCIQTRCHHWFHMSCLKSYERAERNRREVDARCPLCRFENPTLGDEDSEEVVKGNVYDVEVEIPEREAEDADEVGVVLYIGSLVATDGKFENPTDLGACVKIRLI